MSMLSDRLLLLLVVCVSVGRINAAANIDTLEPIVRVSPAQSGNKLDLFGYSVVLHQIVEPTPGDFQSSIDSTRIIVGAPNGTFPGGLLYLVNNNSDSVNQTGLVYQCPISNVSCGPVGRRNESDTNARRLFDDEPDGTNLISRPDPPRFNVFYAEEERKTGQLIGQVLRSSGDYFLACAPLWISLDSENTNTVDRRKPTGRCFLSGKDLSEFTEIRTCYGETSNAPWSVIGENRCQLGLGSTFFESPEQDLETRLFLGAPGALNGIGNLYVYNNVSRPETFDDLGYNPALSVQFEDINVGTQHASSDTRRITIGGNAAGNAFISSGGRVTASAYEGWSLATGNIFGPTDPLSFISGMPRYDDDRLVGKVNVRSSNLSLLGVQILGEQMGEYFGHAVVTADLNSDGFDEVIVGAPLFSRPVEIEAGRVYIYENNNGVINETAIVLHGNHTRGRFGHSIINLGDVNGDEIADIAVSAPYVRTDDDNAQGVVYIYYGNTETVISRFPDQIIPSDVVLNTIRSSNPSITSLKTFGFSLGGTVDVDANGYGDLVVGAYDSQIAVLFRTLSVARINFTLSTDVSTVNIISESSINVTVCATYQGRGLDNRPLNVSYSLTEDKQILLGNAVSRTMPSEYSGEIRFPTTGEETCDSTVVQFVPVTTVMNGLRLRDPIVMELAFSLIERTFSKNGELIDFRAFPLIRSTSEPTVAIKTELGCPERNGDQEVCRPDLAVTPNRILYISPNSMHSSIVAGIVERVEFDLRIENLAEDPSINSFLDFTLPSGIPFTFMKDTDNRTSCSSNASNSAMIRCRLPTYIPGNTGLSITLVWNVDASRVIGTEPSQTVVFTVGIPDSPDSELITNNSMAVVNLPVTAETSPTVSIPDIGPFEYDATPAMEPPRRAPSDLGDTFDIAVRVTNAGFSTIPIGRLDIDIPVRAPALNGVPRYYIYVGDELMTEQGRTGIVCGTEGVNPERIDFIGRRASRKRSVAKRQIPDSNGMVFESCADPSAMACQTFSCNISSFAAGQEYTVTIVGVRDRRFYSTVVGDITFNLRMFARFISLDNFDMFENTASVLEADTTIVITPRPLGPPDIQLEVWLPIVGALLAILLIIILFVCCIYCGFFRKKRLEQAKKDAEGEFEIRQVPPESPAVITGEDKKVDDLGEGVAPAKGEEADDIGDASDLEGKGGSGEAEKDPEETSL